MKQYDIKCMFKYIKDFVWYVEAIFMQAELQ